MNRYKNLGQPTNMQRANVIDLLFPTCGVVVETLRNELKRLRNRMEWLFGASPEGKSVVYFIFLVAFDLCTAGLDAWAGSDVSLRPLLILPLLLSSAYCDRFTSYFFALLSTLLFTAAFLSSEGGDISVSRVLIVGLPAAAAYFPVAECCYRFVSYLVSLQKKLFSLHREVNKRDEIIKGIMDQIVR